MNKRILSLITISLMMSMLAGCGMFDSKIPNMTEEQTKLVVEYASDTLLKYDTDHSPRLGAMPEELIKVEEVIEESAPEYNEEMTVEEPQNDIMDVEVIDNSQEAVEAAMDLDVALGMSDEFDFVYDGYEVTDSYPESLDEYFVMNASKGCKLIIIKFKINNLTGQLASINMPEKNARFKVSLNGKSKNALTTMLLNDMAYYKDNIEANLSADVVVVAEFTDEEASQIDELKLILKLDDGNVTINLD